MTGSCFVTAALDQALWSFAPVIREFCAAIYLSSHVLLGQEQVLLTLDSTIAVQLSKEDTGGLWLGPALWPSEPATTDVLGP